MLRGLYHNLRHHGAEGTLTPWVRRRARNPRVQSFVHCQSRRVLDRGARGFFRDLGSLVRRGCLAAGMTGAGWVLLESARALQLF